MTKREFLDIVFALAPTEANAIMDAFDEYVESAQLSTNLAEVGTDCISRQAAIDYFVTNVGFHDEDGYPIEDECELREIWTGYFDGIPSTQPEIIYCKDCNHFYKDNLNQWCFLGKYGVKENGFCSRAERREVTE